MSFVKKFTKLGGKQAERARAEELAVAGADEGLNLEQDPELQGALQDFRLSILAWSEEAYSRPRAMVAVARSRRWRVAAGWAFGCLLALAGVSGSVYGHLHRRQAATWNHQLQQEATMATNRSNEPARAATEQREPRVHEDEEDLLAKVNTDVSRQIPSAMEPLAQLMTEDETQ
jgi:hypothetical protein